MRKIMILATGMLGERDARDGVRQLSQHKWRRRRGHRLDGVERLQQLEWFQRLRRFEWFERLEPLQLQRRVVERQQRLQWRQRHAARRRTERPRKWHGRWGFER
jgi:hypothetical protein